MKRTYEFTLKFAVPVRTAQADDWIDRLAEAGCDDALIGTGIPGRLALDFDRLATDADSALHSPVGDVQRAIPEAREPLNKSSRSAFQSERPQIVRAVTSDSSRRYGRVRSRASCGLSGETPPGRAFAGPPPCLGSLIWNNQTALAQAKPKPPAKAPSRPRRLVQRFPRLIEAGPDYVGLTEIAELLGISRQAMRKIMAKNIETSPMPVHEGNPSIWHLKDVLGWMREERGRAVDAAVEEVSAIAWRVNSGR